MKHYPVMAAGEKAAAYVDLRWNTATVGISFSHRKGQKIQFDLSEKPDSVISIWQSHDSYYSTVGFEVKTAGFYGPREAASYCASLIKSVHKSVNFDADSKLISKELLIILG